MRDPLESSPYRNQLPQQFTPEIIEGLTSEQYLRRECLRFAVQYHAGNPNITLKPGGTTTVFATADKFYNYVVGGNPNG